MNSICFGLSFVLASQMIWKKETEGESPLQRDYPVALSLTPPSPKPEPTAKPGNVTKKAARAPMQRVRSIRGEWLKGASAMSGTGTQLVSEVAPSRGGNVSECVNEEQAV